MLKTIASLGKEKYERIGATKAKEILRGMDYMTRSKLKAEAINLGTSKVSILNFTKHISKTHGAVAASKFINATQRNFNKGIDPKIQKTNLKANMQRDLTDRETKQINFAGGQSLATGVSTQQTPRTKGIMGDIGVKRGEIGFAQNLSNKKLPDNQPPKTPPVGTPPSIRLAA